MAVFDGVISAIVGAANAGGEFQIDRSLRFNSADSAYLNRTPSSAGNRKTWTWAGWVKLCGSNGYIFSGGNLFYLYVYPTGVIRMSTTSAGANSTRVLRDNSAWYHFVLAVDSTQATQSNRIKFYINGELDATNFGSILSQNEDTAVNSANIHTIGKSSTTSEYFDGYLAEVYFIDGQALAPTDFGEYDDNNVWQPKEYSGTYGTNGFHLDFSDTSDLGADAAGSNDWTPNNLVGDVTVYSDNVTVNQARSDAPATNLFDGSTSTYVQNTSGLTNPNVITITFDSISYSTSVEAYVQSGDTSVSINDGSFSSITSGSFQTIVSGSGTLTKLEFSRASTSGVAIAAIRVDGTILEDGDPATIDSLIDTPTNYEASSGNNGGNYATLNPLQKSSGSTLTNGNLDISMSSAQGTTFATMAFPASGKYYFECTANASQCDVGIAKAGASLSEYLGNNTSGYGYYIDGNVYHNNSSAGSGASYGSGDVIGVAFDADAGTCKWYKNNALQVTISSLSGEWFPAFGAGSAAGIFNFGSRPFAYTPPSNHVSLCTQNLSDPTIADGSTAMDAVVYSSTGSPQTISDLNISPDLVWIKNRSAVVSHRLYDIIRGVNKPLTPNQSSVEANEIGLSAFNSDGFSLSGSRQEVVGNSGDSLVAWAWDGGSSTVSNTDGSITSTVRDNASAGFSIVTYTGTGSLATVGHGLGAAPSFIIVKARSTTYNWSCYHISTGKDYVLNLNTTGAGGSGADSWGSAAPTSTVFGVKDAGPENNGSGVTFVAYCFAPVAGYSSFGSYTGNGSSDGPFVFTGMRPKWIMVKRTNGLAPWVIVDTVRNTYNVMDNHLLANDSAAENGSTIGNICDSLSNGFKIRGSDGWFNNSGGNYIYATFSEHPFKTARAR